jgi:3-hydroxyisobutyrate dehydrogenase-like beta-hydroxyacid dehydrogenase
MRIGCIELGRMGKQMARRLVDAGHIVVVRDLDPDAERPLLDSTAGRPMGDGLARAA